MRSSELMVVALFRLLGWAFAEEGRKCVPFSHVCEALGVLFDLQRSEQGICRISNTASRIEEVSAESERILGNGSISQLDAQRLRGRMQFADAQVYGRTGRRCTKALRDFACRKRTKIGPRDRLFLELFVKLLRSEKSRMVEAERRCHLVIFTDACYERDSREMPCGLGGVLVDPSTNMKKFFSLPLEQEGRALLGEDSKKQIIFEAETLCAVVAHLLWIKEIEGKKCFIYVDNEGTKFSLIRGASENTVVDVLAQIFAENEVQVSTLSWIARVSSFSNIADSPSRGDTNSLLKNGFEDASADAMICLAAISATLKVKLGEMAGSTCHPRLQNGLPASTCSV